MWAELADAGGDVLDIAHAGQEDDVVFGLESWKSRKLDVDVQVRSGVLEMMFVSLVEGQT